MLALLLGLALQVPLATTEIQTRIPKTPWVLSLSLLGWKESGVHDPLRQALGEKLVYSGTLEPDGTSLTLIAEPNGALASPAAWRKRFAVSGTPFECQLSACVDATSKTADATLCADFHAYTCAAGYCFDLHLTRIASEGKPVLERAEFERIAQSLRVLLLRRGWAECYPDELGYQMTLAALAGPDRKAWRENYLPKHGGEWTAHFVEAEFLRYEKAPLERQIASYQRSLELLAKLEKPGPKERYGWAMACEGLALALYDAQRVAETIAPLEQGYRLLAEINRKERAPLAYELACARALTMHEPEAIDALEQAIAADAHYRESAATDANLAALRALPAFQKLITPPAK